MEFEYLPVTIEEMPVRKVFDIRGTEFDFEFSYNSVGDIVTVIIRDLDDNILFTTCLAYGSDLNHVVVSNQPSVPLIPISIDDLFSDQINDIICNKETFGNTVQIYVGKNS